MRLQKILIIVSLVLMISGVWRASTLVVSASSTLSQPQLDSQSKSLPASPSSALHVASATAEMVIGSPRTQFEKGRILQIISSHTTEFGGYRQTTQQLRVILTTGSQAGHIVVVEKSNLNAANNDQPHSGDSIVVSPLPEPSIAGAEYVFIDYYRLPQVGWILMCCLFLIVVLSGRRGLMASLGLCFSIFVLLQFMVPQISSGKNPLVVSIVTAIIIGVVSLYLAHGFHRRTTLALMGSLITATLTTLLAASLIGFAKIFGSGSEEALSLQIGNLGHVNLQGLYLGGIIIGALGVLDDITTAQVAAVWEIWQAKPSLSFPDLYERGLRVGKEHITSLVNTLALAYAGSSLPLLLMFRNYQQPLWLTLNSEFVMEEVVRTLLGSMALILAVPITTLLAAWVFAGGNGANFAPTATTKKSHSHS